MNKYRVLLVVDYNAHLSNEALEEVKRFEKDTLGIELDVTVKHVSADLKFKSYGIRNFAKGKEEVYGLTKIKEQLSPTISPHVYHAVVFLYNDIGTKWRDDNKKALLGHWTRFSPIFSNTEFIEMHPNGNKQFVRVLTHELRHAYQNALQRQGINVPDVMDVTTIMDYNTGKLKDVAYYRERNVYDVPGNRSVANALLKPYVAQITNNNVLRKYIQTLKAKVTALRAKLHGGHIKAWAEATKHHEGWYVGSRSYRNNSSSNARYVGQYKAIGADKDNYAVFPDYDTGFEYLQTILKNAATGKSKTYNKFMTLYQYYAVYAPVEDDNDPTHYAEVVAKALGVSPNIAIWRLA